MQKPNNQFDVVAIGSNFNKPKVYYHKLMNSGSSFDIGTSLSSCDKVVLDIKSIISSHVSSNQNLSKDSSTYAIDEINPCEVVLKGKAPVSIPFIKGLISYNKRSGVVEVNTSSIFSKGFFPFSLIFNFSAEGYTRTSKVLSKPIIKIVPEGNSSNLFDGLSVRLSKENTNSPDALIIDEFKRFAQDRMFTFIKNESFGCDGINVGYYASGDYQFDDVGGLKNITVTNEADVSISRGFPLVNIHDRSEAPFLNSYIKYANSNPRLHTNINHSQYINADGIAFYDQVVYRALMDETGISRDHPLVGIRDIFSSVKSSSLRPALHFRREYSKSEDKRNGKVPYHIYFAPEYVMPSESYVPCINMEIYRAIASNLEFELKIKNRSKNYIELESKTTYTYLKEQKIFYGYLSINLDVNSPPYSMDFGVNEVFHVDEDVDYVDVATRGISVMDVLKALEMNLGGKVSAQSPKGTNSPTHKGFVPTLKEIGIDLGADNEPVVQFSSHANYEGLALMAAARLWMGNKSNYDVSEVGSINLKGFSLRDYINCKGLKNVVRLDNYVSIAPLNRCLTTPFVRGEIKSFEQHLKDGDFVQLENNGPGYNRFYKYDTIRKSIDIMKYGHSYFSSTLKLPAYEVNAMMCPGPASNTKTKGQERKLFGASQIGVSIFTVNKNKETEFGFFNQTPSYMLSHFGFGINNTIDGSNLSKTCSELPSSNGDLFIYYRNTSMFPGPYSYIDKDYVPDPFLKGINEYGEDDKRYFGGGKFHVLYSTSGIGSHLSQTVNINDLNAVEYSTTLNPFEFDNDALLIYEGGDVSDPVKRTVNISACHKWIENSPLKERITSAFIKKDMVEWARERGWQIGKTILINFETQNQKSKVGSVYITGSGQKKVQSFLTYNVDEKLVHFADNIGTNEYVGNLVNNFKSVHDKTFAGLLSIELAPSIRPTDIMPYDMLLFGKIVNKPPFVPPVTPIEPYYYPYNVEPYSYEPYGTGNDVVNPYDSMVENYVYFGNIEIIESSYSQNLENPYSDAGEIINPYVTDAYIEINPYEIYNPYVPAPSRVQKGFYTVYQNLVRTNDETGLKFYIDYINQNNYTRSYTFYLNNRRYGSIKDIVDDINNTIGDYGIKAYSLVENPEAYSTRRLSAKEPTNIINAYYEFEKVISYESPYAQYSIPEPYADVSEFAYNPYISNSDLLLTSDLPSEEIISDGFLVGYFKNYSQKISDAYVSDIVYGQEFVEVNPYFNYTTPSAGKYNLNSPFFAQEVGSISYERVRRVDLGDSVLDIEYEVYHEQGPESQKISFDFVSKSSNFYPVKLSNEKSNRPRELIVLQENFEKPAEYIYGELAEDLADDSFVESSFINSNNGNNGNVEFRILSNNFAALPPGTSGIEVAYGGQISANGISINGAPNTYFSNANQLGIGQIEFRTVDADFALIYVQILYADGRYGPPNNGSNEFGLIQARVTYSSTEDPETIVGTVAPDQAIEIKYEDPETPSTQYIVHPVQLKIPLKSVISFVQISMNNSGVLANVKVLNVPSELNEFGFIAVNNNNPNYNMGESRGGRSFGLVLDNFGNYDILIAPEATMANAEFGDFNFNGKGYIRNSTNVDETYIAGIGDPIIDPEDGDITGFNASSIPSSYRQHISLIAVPGYQQVWVLRISPVLRSLMMQARRSSPPGSFDNCYVDVPIYFQGNTTESAGTCNVRIFADVKCVFDYNFCDFFWNLGSPLLPPAGFSVNNDLVVNFQEWINCENSARSIVENAEKKVEITSYFFMDIQNIPTLDNGNALLLIKGDFTGSNLRSVSNPDPSEIVNLRFKSGTVSQRPWEFECSFLDSEQRAKVNKPIIYTNPQNYSEYSINPSEIINLMQTRDKFLLIQPKFKFPLSDEIGISSPNEVIVASIGFSFKDWKPALNRTWREKILLKVKFVVPASSQNANLLQNFSIRYLYREDRRLK